MNEGGRKGQASFPRTTDCCRPRDDDDQEPRVNQEKSKKRAEEIVKEAIATNIVSVAEGFKVLTTEDQPGTTKVHKEEQVLSSGLEELQQPAHPAHPNWRMSQSYVRKSE